MSLAYRRIVSFSWFPYLHHTLSDYTSASLYSSLSGKAGSEQNSWGMFHPILGKMRLVTNSFIPNTLLLDFSTSFQAGAKVKRTRWFMTTTTGLHNPPNPFSETVAMRSKLSPAFFLLTVKMSRSVLQISKAQVKDVVEDGAVLSMCVPKKKSTLADFYATPPHCHQPSGSCDVP